MHAQLGISSTESPEGERKQASILVGEMVNTAELAERLGPEGVLAGTNAFFDVVRAEVGRYGGTVNEFLGDGFVALFGIPVAHEDHARRAVLAAIALRRRLNDSGDFSGATAAEPLAMQFAMGASTGLVAVARTSDGPSVGYRTVGETLSVAARLKDRAEPGMILISDATARLVSGYARLEPVEPVHVRGKSEPVTAFRVEGVGPRRSPLDTAGARPLSRFVGREREMSALHELLTRAGVSQASGSTDRRPLSRFVGRDYELEALFNPLAQAEAGHGQVVGVVGEPGMGKSRLLYEFRRSLGGQWTTYLEGRCLSYGGAVPYLPILDIIRANCGISDGDSPKIVTDKVGFGLQEVGLDAEEWSPYLLELLGMKEGTDALAPLSPEAIKVRTFDVLRQWALRGSERRPIIIAIEDLHWIDTTSEEYLASLVESLAGARVLLLCTYRPGYRPPWVEHSYATQLSLRRLGAQDSLSLVQSAVEGMRLPADLANVVLERAEGNPFFLEELARAVGDGDEVQVDSVVPETVHGVLMARIDRLPEAPRRVLQYASVLGREFSVRLLNAIWDAPGSIGPHLEVLKRQEFVYEQVAAGEHSYVFKHALTQDVAYESLLVARRKALHAAAGRALERLYADRLDEVYDRLAHHYAQTDDAVRAVEYLTRFAEKAARVYANADAARALEQAIDHVANLPADEVDMREIELVLRLSHSYYFVGRVPATLDLLLGHRERVERLQDPRLAGQFYFWLAHTYTYLSDLDGAAASAQRAIEAASSCGDEATLGKAHYTLARRGFLACQFRDGVEHGQQAIALLERNEEPFWLGQSYWAVGFNHELMGAFDAGLEAASRARAIGEARADIRIITYADWLSGWLYGTRGDWEDGIRVCTESLEQSRDAFTTIAATGWMGYAYLEKGDPAEAIPKLEFASNRCAQYGYRTLQLFFDVWLAEALRTDGQTERAGGVANEAVDAGREVGSPYVSAWALRVLGRMALSVGALEEAERRLTQAHAIFTEIESHFESGKAHLDLAELARLRHDEGRARQHVKAARAVFARCQAARYVERAEAFERVTNSPAMSDPLATLTAREREVTALIARGLSNRQIAQQLVIADGTVNIHVSNILSKLGCSSRTQVAALILSDHGSESRAS